MKTVQNITIFYPVYLLLLVLTAVAPLAAQIESQNSVNNYFSVAENYFIQHDYERAATYFEKSYLVKERPNNLTIIWLAKSLLAADKIDDALNYLSRYISNAEEDAYTGEAYYLLARSHYLKEQYPRAIGYFSYFLNNYSDRLYTPASYYWIGESLYRLGYLEEAQQILTMISLIYNESYLINLINSRIGSLEIEIIRAQILDELESIPLEEDLPDLVEDTTAGIVDNNATGEADIPAVGASPEATAPTGAEMVMPVAVDETLFDIDEILPTGLSTGAETAAMTEETVREPLSPYVEAADTPSPVGEDSAGLSDGGLITLPESGRGDRAQPLPVTTVDDGVVAINNDIVDNIPDYDPIYSNPTDVEIDRVNSHVMDLSDAYFDSIYETQTVATETEVSSPGATAIPVNATPAEIVDDININIIEAHRTQHSINAIRAKDN